MVIQFKNNVYHVAILVKHVNTQMVQYNVHNVLKGPLAKIINVCMSVSKLIITTVEFAHRAMQVAELVWICQVIALFLAYQLIIFIKILAFKIVHLVISNHLLSKNVNNVNQIVVFVMALALEIVHYVKMDFYIIQYVFHLVLQPQATMEIILFISVLNANHLV